MLTPAGDPCWCPHCHQDTLRPTGRHPEWHTDPPPIDADEYWEFQCQNPICEEIWRAMGQDGPWTSARKHDGSHSRDPRWSELVEMPRKEAK